VLTLAGWGATTGTGGPSAHLRWGRVKVTAVRATTILVTGYQPSRSTGACAYDSGAPYLYTSATGVVSLVSVESTGPTCPHRLQETTARVQAVAPWVRSVVTDLPR
jgi:hypothetical protein